MIEALSGTEGESPTWFLITIGVLMLLYLIRYGRSSIAWFRQLYENDPKPGDRESHDKTETDE